MPSKTTARALRSRMTDAERKMWFFLRNRAFDGHKFRRQHVLGKYVVDFVCLEKRLILEIDGGQHVAIAAEDTERSAWLTKEGFCVLRFWNNNVLRDMDMVGKVVWGQLECNGDAPLTRAPRDLSHGGER